MTPRRRYRAPNSTALVILLSGIVGTIAMVAVVVAIAFAGRVSEVSNANAELLKQTTASRREAFLTTCRKIENVKADGRAILRTFKVPRESLPTHADGTYAFDPVHVGCDAQADQLITPRP